MCNFHLNDLILINCQSPCPNVTNHQSEQLLFWTWTAGHKCITSNRREMNHFEVNVSETISFNVAWQMVNRSKMMSIQQIIEQRLDRRANIYQNLTLMSAPEIYTSSKCCHYQTQNFQQLWFYKITQSRSHQHQLLGLTDILEKPEIQMFNWQWQS